MVRVVFRPWCKISSHSRTSAETSSQAVAGDPGLTLVGEGGFYIGIDLLHSNVYMSSSSHALDKLAQVRINYTN